MAVERRVLAGDALLRPCTLPGARAAPAPIRPCRRCPPKDGRSAGTPRCSLRVAAETGYRCDPARRARSSRARHRVGRRSTRVPTSRSGLRAPVATMQKSASAVPCRVRSRQPASRALDAQHASLLDGCARAFRALQQHAVQIEARIDEQGLRSAIFASPAPARRPARLVNQLLGACRSRSETDTARRPCR